jgi:hypothetical protein
MVRRSLGRRLKVLRLAANKSPADVEVAKLGSRHKLWRIEKGIGPAKPGDVRGLCWLYGAPPEVTDELADLALQSLQETIWEEYKNRIPSWFSVFIELESSARSIEICHSVMIPGLLQTADYARATFAAAVPAHQPEALEHLLEARMLRQRNVFARSDVQISAVIDEGAIARQVGGPDVWAGQLAHLRQVSDRDNVDVRVLPAAAGAYAAMAGMFVLLGFPDPDEPAVVYQESQFGSQYLELPDLVESFRDALEFNCKQSISFKEYS